MSDHFGVAGKTRPSLPLAQAISSSGADSLPADPLRTDSLGTHGHGSRGDTESPTPFEVFVARAVGAAPSGWKVPGLPDAVGRFRVRARLVMAVVAVGVAAGLGWWVLSAVGSGGSAMDPDLPFATEAGPVVGNEAAGEARGDPTTDGANPKWPGGGSPGSSDLAGSGAPSSGGSAAGGVMVVHMAGAVMVPGVHSVSMGARVHDAVVAAGGARSDADLDRLNLAAPLVDGSRVYVPMIGELTPPPLVDGGTTSITSGSQANPGPTGSGTITDGGRPISLSTASSTDLQSLPGVGPSTAEAIIAYRDANGPFTAVDQLLDVRGIGPAKLSAVRDLVVP